MNMIESRISEHSQLRRIIKENHKKRIIIFMILIIVLDLSACNIGSKNKFEGETIMLEVLLDKIAHIRDPVMIGTYIFRLFSNGNLEVFFGEEHISGFYSRIRRFTDDAFLIHQNFDNFINSNYLVIIESGSVIISSEQLMQFEEKINQLKEESEPAGSPVMGIGLWRVILRVGNKKQGFIYGVARDETLDEIVDMLIEVSPVEVIANPVIPPSSYN